MTDPVNFLPPQRGKARMVVLSARTGLAERTPSFILSLAGGGKVRSI
jgi:hypothetical protein